MTVDDKTPAVGSRNTLCETLNLRGFVAARKRRNRRRCSRNLTSNSVSSCAGNGSGGHAIFLTVALGMVAVSHC
jgi:hypothetical protein